MSTKVCSGCGWVFPFKTPYYSCTFCSTGFTAGVCSKCGKPSNDMIKGRSVCRQCYNVDVRKYGKYNPEYAKKAYAEKRAEAKRRLEEWLELLASNKTHTLKESEWLEVCQHFNGCALCDNEHIAARGYFIPFKLGGKYNRFNVIPLCEQCATEQKKQLNPFRRLHKRLNRRIDGKRGLSIEKVDKVVDYLSKKMEEAKDE